MEESSVCGHLQEGTRHKHTLPLTSVQKPNPSGCAQSIYLGRGGISNIDKTIYPQAPKEKLSPHGEKRE